MLGHHLRFMANMQLFKQWDFQTKVFKGSPSNLQMLMRQCFVALDVLRQGNALHVNLFHAFSPSVLF